MEPNESELVISSSLDRAAEVLVSEMAQEFLEDHPEYTKTPDLQLIFTVYGYVVGKLMGMADGLAVTINNPNPDEAERERVMQNARNFDYDLGELDTQGILFISEQFPMLVGLQHKGEPLIKALVQLCTANTMYQLFRVRRVRIPELPDGGYVLTIQGGARWKIVGLDNVEQFTNLDDPDLIVKIQHGNL